MKQKILNCFLILLLTAGLTSTGVAAETQKTLSLETAINICLKSNLTLKQAANRVTSGRITVKQKKADFLPDLNFSLNTSKHFGKAYNPADDHYAGQNSTRLNLTLSSQLNLFNGFYDKASMQQARLQLKAAQKNLSRSTQSAVFETVRRFFQVVTSGEALQVEKENLEAQKLQLIRIEEFCKAGRRPQTDLFQQKAEIASAEYRILDAQRNHDAAKLKLKQTLGLEADTDYDVKAPDRETLLAHRVPRDKDAHYKTALGKRPDLAAQKKQVEAAEKGVKAAKSGYLPKLSLYAEAGSNYSSLFEYTDFSDQFFNGNINGKVGLSLSVPLFDRSRAKTNVAEARLQVANGRLEMEKLKQQVAVDVKQAIEDYVTAVKQVEVTAAQLAYSQAALNGVQERYNVNAATMVELTEARSRYLEARLSRMTAEYDLILRAVATAYYNGDQTQMLSLINLQL